MNRTIEVNKLGGVAEISEILGCAKQQIVALRRTTTFPEPVTVLASTPVWDLDEIESFKACWKRHGKRSVKVEETAPAEVTAPAETYTQLSLFDANEYNNDVALRSA